ncbi:MAG: sigma-70 family RNA polymerase sigma factor, partial [Pirellulaceae bacterium]
MKEDSLLIRETLAGDTGAFDQLVQKYQDRLYNTLVHALGNRHEAEDVMQDAFFQAHTKLSTFKGKSAFYTWLYRIAFNASVSRRRRKRPVLSTDQQQEAFGEEPRDETEQAEDTVLREERADMVHEALASLSEEHRSILVLREMDGCCYDTIADILALSPGTVRSRLHRARMQLR